LHKRLIVEELKGVKNSMGFLEAEIPGNTALIRMS
jgi:hypothetical protein